MNTNEKTPTLATRRNMNTAFEKFGTSTLAEFNAKVRCYDPTNSELCNVSVSPADYFALGLDEPLTSSDGCEPLQLVTVERTYTIRDALTGRAIGDGDDSTVEDRLEVQQLEREQDEPLRDLLDLIDGHDDEYPAGAADALRAVLRDAKRNLAHEPIIIYEAELGGWDARCSCGWRSAGTFPSEEKAGAEADKHVQAHGDDAEAVDVVMRDLEGHGNLESR